MDSSFASKLVVKLSGNAKHISRESQSVLNLHCVDTKIISARSRGEFDTQVLIDIPNGYHGRIISISDLASSYGIVANNSVIEADSKESIKILLINHSDIDVEIPTGNIIAQFMLAKTVDIGKIVQERTITQEEQDRQPYLNRRVVGDGTWGSYLLGKQLDKRMQTN